MSGRGLLGAGIDWIIALIVTAFVVTVLFVMVGFFRSSAVDSAFLEHEIYLDKVYFSPHIISKFDPLTKLSTPGVIDLNRFTSRHLESSNKYYDSVITARLSLFDENMKLLPLPENPIYQNEKIFRILEPLASSGVSGRGGATINDFMFPVVFYRGDKLLRGYLRVTTVRPNS